MRRALMLLAVSLLGLPLFGDYKESFRAGVQAADRRQWAAVIRSMEAAIAEKTGEGENIVISRTWERRYIPYYYLALAYSNTGDCAAAMRNLRESRRQGVVGRLRNEMNQLELIEDKCASQVVPTPAPTPQPTVAPVVTPIPTPTPTAAPPTVDPALRIEFDRILESSARAREMLNSLITFRSAPENARIWSATPALRAEENAASQMIAGAANRAEQARKAGNVAELRRIQQQLAASAASLQRLRTTLNEQRELADARVAQQKEAELASTRSQLQSLINSAGQVLRQAGLVKGQRPDVLSQHQALTRQLATAQKALSASTPEAMRKAAEDLSRSISRTRTILDAPVQAPQNRKVPEDLFLGTSAYFNGDYTGALNILEKARFDERRAQAQARLFVAAAQFALAETRGPDETLRSAATANAREARALGAEITDATKRFFSPAFIAMVQNAR